MSRRGWALFIAMCLIWGIPYLLIKVAVSDLSPAALVFLRREGGGVLDVVLPLAGIAVAGYTLYRNVYPVPASPFNVFPYIVAGWLVVCELDLWPRL